MTRPRSWKIKSSTPMLLTTASSSYRKPSWLTPASSVSLWVWSLSQWWAYHVHGLGYSFSPWGHIWAHIWVWGIFRTHFPKDQLSDSWMCSMPLVSFLGKLQGACWGKRWNLWSLGSFEPLVGGLWIASLAEERTSPGVKWDRRKCCEAKVERESTRFSQ